MWGRSWRSQTKWVIWAVGFGLLFATFHSPVWALFNNEDFGTLKFSLVNPGARATALGGAFTGLADDASAAVANPAGLVILGSSELTYEHKFFSFHNTVPFFSSRAASQLIPQDFTDETQGPSFVSFVWPTKQVTLALYRNETANFQQNFRTLGASIAFDGVTTTLFPVDSKLEMLISNIGIAGGVKLHPRLSIGVGVEFSSLDFNSILNRFCFPGDAPLCSQRTINDVNNRTQVDTEDDAFGFRFGLLWEPLDGLKFGLLYSRGPRFAGQGEKLVNQASRGINEEARFTSSGSRPFVLKVPDVVRVGSSYKLFRGRLTLAVDVERVMWSDLVEGFETVFDPSFGRPQDFAVDDRFAVHVGLEGVVYVAPEPERAFLSNLTLRAGFATDPDHQIKYTKNPTNINERVIQVLFLGGQDELVGSFGFGAQLYGRISVDSAFSYTSDQSYVSSLSILYRF